MNSNIPRPTWRKPEPPKSFWQKFFTGMLGTLSGFFAVIPTPKNIFLRPMSYFVRGSEQNPGEKAETKNSDQKVKEMISQDVSRQVALWRETADEEKDVVVYKVSSGDSLWKIAQNQYNWGERWIDIWTANRISIKEPNLIFAGQELKIPKQILRRTALFQSPALAPQKSAVKTAGGELMKKQIITAARSIEQTGLRNVSLINQKLITAKMTSEQKTIAAQISNQINGNIVDARNYARQAGSITNFNSNSIDLSVRTLDLGRETIQLAQAAESIPSPTVASTTPTMAWSQDTAGNIKYYTKQNGAWISSEVNPIGNIGAVYGTQDITQTPEYKSGKIIKIAPQSVPTAPAAPAPAPYGGAVLNTEQQVIYERLKSSRGVDAEIYKQTVLGSSPHVVAANAAVVKTDMGVVALNTSIASQTVGESVSAGPTHTSSVFQKSITAAAASVRVISGNSVLSETVTAEELNNFAQASATNAEAAVAARQTEPAVVQTVLAVEAAIAANIVAPNSQAAASASESAGEAIAALQSINPAEVQQVLIAVANSANQEILNQGGDGAGNVPGPSSPGISSQGSDTSSSDSTSQTSFDTSVTGSTLSFQFGENTLGHITANPPSGIIGQGVANLTGSNVFGTIVNAGIGIVNLFAGVANTLIGVGVNLATDQETSISPFSFATTPQQAWSGLSGTQQGFQTQRAGEIASQNAPTSSAGVASAVGDVGLGETSGDIGEAAAAGVAASAATDTAVAAAGNASVSAGIAASEAASAAAAAVAADTAAANNDAASAGGAAVSVSISASAAADATNDAAAAASTVASITGSTAVSEAIAQAVDAAVIALNTAEIAGVAATGSNASAIADAVSAAATAADAAAVAAAAVAAAAANAVDTTATTAAAAVNEAAHAANSAAAAADTAAAVSVAAGATSAVDTATSAEAGETGAVDDTSDITLGVQGVVGSAYAAVGEMVANESATAVGMTSSEAGSRTSAEVAAQNASNSAIAGGTISNSTSVTTATGITGTVGIMNFGAAQQSAMTVTLSNGVTASFGMNAGTLASQGLTNEEGQQAMDLALAQTQQALNLMNQPRTITGIDDEGNTVTIDNPAAVPSPNPNINVTMDTPTGIMGEPGNVPSVDNPGAVAAQTSPNTNVSTDTPTGLMGQPTGNAPTGPTSADVDAAAAVDAANAAAGAVTGEPDAGPTSADAAAAAAADAAAAAAGAVTGEPDAGPSGGPSGDAGDGGPGGPSGDGGDY